LISSWTSKLQRQQTRPWVDSLKLIP
jgi:hypothetical protein